MTFLMLLGLGVSHHPQAHCLARDQGTLHLALATAQLRFITAMWQGKRQPGGSREKSRPGFPSTRPPGRKVRWSSRSLPAACNMPSAQKSLVLTPAHHNSTLAKGSRGSPEIPVCAVQAAWHSRLHPISRRLQVPGRAGLATLPPPVLHWNEPSLGRAAVAQGGQQWEQR